jgi:hypothetical protein
MPLNRAPTLESTMNSTPVVQTPAVPAIAEDAGPVSDVVDQATADRIARVNAVGVTVDDLLLAAAEIQKLPLETCNGETRIRCIAPLFNWQVYKVMAVNARLEAMGEIIRSVKVQHWVLPNRIGEVVFLAAAKEPLLLANHYYFFDPESFVAFVLENAAVDGHALTMGAMITRACASNGLNGSVFVSVTCRISGSPVISHSE